ncbi:hypothetical protein B0A49_09737 [Cryomyces minteri]|uniref:Uncharacterized protein n=1 Tax=Cryomyces minteri TaxID=331657 RepID=A0A4U0WHF3_9PEZI|nr:hypothetical protein B0A49_09737 [Cryomyces minteri]
MSQELSEVDSTDIDPEISTALTNTFSSLATILTTIALVSQGEIVGDGNDAETSLITYSMSSLAVDVLRDNDLSDDVSAEGDDATIHDTASDRAYVQRKFPLLISALLLRLNKCRLGKYLVDIDVEACLGYFTDLRTCAPNGHELIPIRSTSTIGKIEESPDTSFLSPTSQIHRAPDLALRPRKTSASLKRHPSSTSLLGLIKLLDSDDEDELSMSESLSRKEALDGRTRSRASSQPRGYGTLRRSAGRPSAQHARGCSEQRVVYGIW